MNVLFSLTYYTPYVSGLTLYVKRLSEALKKKGYSVSVLSFQHDKNLKYNEKISGVSVRRVKPDVRISKGFISIDWLFASFWEVKKHDVVIINLPQFEGVWPAFWGKILGKKVITVYHCEIDLPKSTLNSTIEAILSLSHYLTLLLSDTIVTYTADFRKYSHLLPFFSEKVECIYPYIKRPNINKRVQNIIKEKIGPSQLTIGVAARLAAEKGIEYLLHAIPLLNKNKIPCKIVIAGPQEPVGEEAYKEKINKLVEEYADQVLFLGPLQEEDMGSFYSMVDILVLPSINSTESFGMVQVEAMLSGVPVISSNLPGVRVPIEKTGMGLIVPRKNSSAIASAILEIVTNRKKYIKDKRGIEKEFTSQKTVVFYEKLLHR